MILTWIINKYGTNFSDLFFIYGQKAKIKINGKLEDLSVKELNKGEPFIVNEKFIRKFFIDYYIKKKGEHLLKIFETETDFDTSIELNDKILFRANFLLVKGKWSVVLRLINNEIPEFGTLTLPLHLLDLTNLNSGLVLVTGVTGSGKSTTLASLINEINKKYQKHILTIEDPIEFVHKPIKCLITQRELNVDVNSFSTALKAALRESPNVILVGEMRDKETIEATLKAAETGHLVFSTIHTYNAVQTIERILSYFEGNEQNKVRYSLANTLRAIISQKLIIGLDNKLHLAYEILYNSLGVSSNIKENKLTQVPIAAKNDPVYKEKNILLNEQLAKMVRKKIISEEVALQYSYNPEELKLLLNKR